MQGKYKLGLDMFTQANGWYKELWDGTFEEGWDHLINSKRASWIRGRQDIVAAYVYFDGLLTGISSNEEEGVYWQSDEWEVPLFTSGGYLIKRRIQKRIELLDKYILEYSMQEDLELEVVHELDSIHQDFLVKELSLEDVGQWLTVEIDIQKKEISWYISKSKI